MAEQGTFNPLVAGSNPARFTTHKLTHKEEMMTFAYWMKLVDDLVWQLVGCSIHDLPDCGFRTWYDDGLAPEEAAERAIKEA